MGLRKVGWAAPFRLSTGMRAHATFAPQEMQVQPPVSVHAAFGSSMFLTKFSTSDREFERSR